MTFYEDMEDVSFEILNDFGKEITVRREKSDINKTNPWEGKTDDVETFTAFAVFDKVDDSNIDPTLVRVTDLLAYIPSKGNDFTIEIKDKIIDGSDTYEIITLEEIKPSTTSLLFKLTLRK